MINVPVELTWLLLRKLNRSERYQLNIIFNNIPHAWMLLKNEKWWYILSNIFNWAMCRERYETPYKYSWWIFEEWDIRPYNWDEWQTRIYVFNTWACATDNPKLQFLANLLYIK